MPRGGKRPGAGRPRGSPTKRSAKRALDAALSDIGPAEHMLERMRFGRATGDFELADKMAIAVAPYCVPQLRVFPLRRLVLRTSLVFPQSHRRRHKATPL